MKISRQKLRIGELATKLNVETFVIRFWEKEFNIKGVRSQGGQRCYDAKDTHKFNVIKSLLYEHGYTIAGAKKYIQEHSFKKINCATITPAPQNILASSITTMEPADELIPHATPAVTAAPEQTAEPASPIPAHLLPTHVKEQLVFIQQKLIKLKALLPE